MIGFIIPTKQEAASLLNLLSSKKEKGLRGFKATTGFLGTNECVVLVTGIGKVFSAAGTQQLIDNFNPSLVVHFGIAGALAPHLKVSDFILGEYILEHDHYSHYVKNQNARPRAYSDKELIKKLLTYLEKNQHTVYSGIMLSGNEDIVKISRREELFLKHTGLSVDWESFAVAKVCNICQIPCIVIRTISDFADEHTADQVHLNFNEVSKKLSSVLMDFIQESDFNIKN